MLQAVLFDLDGTLLQVNAEKFVREYLKEISAATAAVVKPEHFIRELLASTKVMQQNRNHGQTNAEVFWADFRSRIGNDNIEKLKPLLEEYYAHRFNHLSRIAGRREFAGEAVLKALELGLRIVLATNPVFPESAIRDRMEWAGVGRMPWDLVTSYENMHYSKPHPEYYLEIASKINVAPSDCLMVGNELHNDIIPASVARMRTFLIADSPDSPVAGEGGTVPADGSGALSDFIAWLNDYFGNDS